MSGQPRPSETAPFSLYRAEALAHRSVAQTGHLLNLSPRWTRWAYWLIAVVCAVGIAFAAFARVDEYASGPAVVRVERAGPNGSASVVALLPGHFRPQLARGMPLTLVLEGYPQVYRDLRIDSLADGIVGPAEVRRQLGPALADTIAVQGPTLMVTARLDGTFHLRGRRYQLHDGMRARVDVPVDRSSLLAALVPGLRAVGRARD